EAVALVVRISARDSATSGQSASGDRCHEAANAISQTSTSSAERAKCGVLQSSESNGKGQVAPALPGKQREGPCSLPLWNRPVRCRSCFETTKKRRMANSLCIDNASGTVPGDSTDRK